jgi:hypothetical protein
MKRKDADSATRAARAAHVETLLDEALKATFPASDPVAIAVEAPDVASGTPPEPGMPVRRGSD